MQLQIVEIKFSSVSDEQTHKYKKPANGGLAGFCLISAYLIFRMLNFEY